MSLRKSPELTPKLLAAARQNAQHSTWTPALRQAQGRLYAGAKTTHENTKMNKRRRNIIENKGALWKTRVEGGNVLEKKGLIP
jgi:hypothetical protein